MTTRPTKNAPDESLQPVRSDGASAGKTTCGLCS